MRHADLPPPDGPIRCFVAGRVQGVFYRASTAERATALGLDGYVRNLADGRVEAVFAGGRDAVTEMVGWLWQGPAGASVDAVTVEPYRGTVPAGFEVRRGP